MNALAAVSGLEGAAGGGGSGGAKPVSVRRVIRIRDVLRRGIRIRCKRPRSSMSPTIATRHGRPILVTGGAGGSRIIIGVLLTTLNRLEFGLDTAHAVDAERLDAQRLEGPVLIEDARIDPAVITELERRGHVFSREGEYAERPRVQAAGYADARGSREEATDPRSPEAGSLAERPSSGAGPSSATSSSRASR